MASALAKYKKEQAHSKVLAGIRRKGRELAEARQHTIFATGAAFGLGWAEKSDVKLPEVAGLAASTTLGVGAYIVAESGWGSAQLRKNAQSLADGLLSISAYKLGQEFGEDEGGEGEGFGG